VLAEGIEVTGASLNNGLLHIDLVRPKIEVRKKVIKINTNASSEDNDDRVIDVETKTAAV
jgi:hypothetical protein